MVRPILTPESIYILPEPSACSFLTTATHRFNSTSHNGFMSVVCLQPNLNFLQERGRHRDVHRLVTVTTGRLKSKSPLANIIFLSQASAAINIWHMRPSGVLRSVELLFLTDV
jgi:hypothetical protein